MISHLVYVVFNLKKYYFTSPVHDDKCKTMNQNYQFLLSIKSITSSVQRRMKQEAAQPNPNSKLFREGPSVKLSRWMRCSYAHEKTTSY